MSWKDKYRKGRFRNADFFTENSDGSLGPRVAVHEYPMRDIPFIEHMGRKIQEFTLEMYVLGPDYMIDRDRLIEALNQEGPGTLVHPYLGTMTVSVLQAAGPKESTRSGGMARFSVTFGLTGENRYPDVNVDTSADVAEKADSAIEKVKEVFEKIYSITRLPEFVASAAEELSGKAIYAVKTATTKLPLIPEEATDLYSKISDISDNLTSLIRLPADLATGMIGLVSGVGGLVSTPAGALKLFKPLWSFGDTEPEITGNTPSQKALAGNQTAMKSLIVQTAKIEAARSSSLIEFKSHNDAIALMEELSDAIELEMLTAEYEIYLALTDLRAAVVRDITERGANLSRVASHTPLKTLPALVIAQRIYGDATKEQEIVDRNKIRHPGFVPGGIPIEVLTHA